MVDAENERHSGKLVLQPLPSTHFTNEKACSSQKQQQQRDLQTCLNNSFQLFSDTPMSKFVDLTSKIVEKVLLEPTLKGIDLGKVDNLMKRGEDLNRHQNQKVSLRNR